MRSAACRNAQERVRETDQRGRGGIGPQGQSRPSCKKRKLDDDDALMTQGMEDPEAADVRDRTRPGVADLGVADLDLGGSGVSDGGARREELDDVNFTNDSLQATCATDLDKSSASVKRTELGASDEEDVDRDSQEPPLSATDQESAERDRLAERRAECTEGQAAGRRRAGPSGCPRPEPAADDDGDSGAELGCDPAYDDQDSSDQPEAVEVMSLGDEAEDSDRDSESVTVFVDGEGNVSTPPGASLHTSPRTSLHGSAASRDDEDRILNLEYEDEQVGRADQERCEDGGRVSSASPSSDGQAEDGQPAAEGCSEVAPEQTTKASRMTQPGGAEDDAELDMLVIDISSSVSEPTTNQAAEGGTVGSTPEYPSQAAERLDPFAHLFETSFPPLDRTHHNAPHPPSTDSTPHPASTDCRSQPGTSDAGKLPPAAAVVKEERDDDCMITAAFISPGSGRKSAPGGGRRSAPGARSAAHTAPGPRGAMLGSGRGRPGHHRQGGGWDRWAQPPAIQQFNLFADGKSCQPSNSATCPLVASLASHPTVEPVC